MLNQVSKTVKVASTVVIGVDVGQEVSADVPGGLLVASMVNPEWDQSHPPTALQTEPTGQQPYMQQMVPC